MAGGAVIALEANDLGAGKIVIEAQDVIDLRAAPKNADRIALADIVLADDEVLFRLVVR